MFDITWRELAFAQKQGGSYSVVRVFGACGGAPGEVSVLRLVDPFKLWRQRVLAVYMVV